MNDTIYTNYNKPKFTVDVPQGDWYFPLPFDGVITPYRILPIYKKINECYVPYIRYLFKCNHKPTLEINGDVITVICQKGE